LSLLVTAPFDCDRRDGVDAYSRRLILDRQQMQQDALGREHAEARTGDRRATGRRRLPVHAVEQLERAQFGGDVDVVGAWRAGPRDLRRRDRERAHRVDHDGRRLGGRPCADLVALNGAAVRYQPMSREMSAFPQIIAKRVQGVPDLYATPAFHLHQVSVSVVLPEMLRPDRSTTGAIA
jgi:hypothetical protein